LGGNRGRAVLNAGRGRGGFGSSVNEAIHRDPQFTLAYAAAAQCHPPMILLGFAPRAEALNEMHSLVDRALELDVNMADAVVSKLR